MKILKKISIRNLCLYAGCGLIALSVIMIAIWFSSASVYEKRCQEYVDILNEIIPPVQSALPEERIDNTMPSLEANGSDFIAIVEFPVFNSTLPVCNEWGNTDRFPRRFTGSIYNNSLIIGASDRKGQVDFVKQLAVGDTVFLTDMTGCKYSYVVLDIIISNDAKLETLQNTDADMTLFINSTLSSQYTIIRLNTRN